MDSRGTCVWACVCVCVCVCADLLIAGRFLCTTSVCVRQHANVVRADFGVCGLARTTNGQQHTPSHAHPCTHTTATPARARTRIHTTHAYTHTSTHRHWRARPIVALRGDTGRRASLHPLSVWVCVCVFVSVCVSMCVCVCVGVRVRMWCLCV